MIVGAWQWPWYEEACADALAGLGVDVNKFGWFPYLRRWTGTNVEPDYRTFWHRVQDRLIAGPAVTQFNRDLIAQAYHLRPDVIWFYNATHVTSSAIEELKSAIPNAKLVQYSNDNPFGPLSSELRWRFVKRAIPFIDQHFVYRSSNVEDFRQAGAKHVTLLRSYFIPEVDRPIRLGPHDRDFECDVVFAGHFENDGRLEALEAIAEQDCRLNLFGGGWKTVDLRTSPLRRHRPISPVVGDNYRKAVCGAKIALCFLSKINGDTYTRRNFEIPAMGAFLLSEYSDDLASLYKEGQECEFFRSIDELKDKVTYYLAHPVQLEAIAQAGRERVHRDGHDVINRMRQFAAQVFSG